MEKKKQRLIKWVLLSFTLIGLLFFFILFYITFMQSRSKLRTQNEYDPADTCLYHVIITGTYENQSFLTELYKGAASLEKSYNAVVDLLLQKQVQALYKILLITVPFLMPMELLPT